MASNFFRTLPSPPLRRFISHYWLSLDNHAPTYSILPDGAVDVVLSQRGSRVCSLAYGTSTSPAQVALTPHAHYLGIRFRPGQSRHFIKATAKELTGRCEAAGELLLFSFDRVTDAAFDLHSFAHIDAILEHQLGKLQPTQHRLDHALALIEAHRGAVTIPDAAAVYARSGRQFERAFLDAVGVTPKFFAAIQRFQHACALMQRRTSSLAAIAYTAGYADQSHMVRDFRRLAGVTPSNYTYQDVGFVQDPTACHPDNGDSIHSGGVR